MNHKHYFSFNDKKFEVPVELDFLNKIGNDITRLLLIQGKYDILSKVKLESFQSFYNFLISSNDIIDVNAENYYDYYLLNTEFNQILSGILSKPEYEELLNESIIQILTIEENRDKSMEEQRIAIQLDHFLDRYSEKMSQIPPTCLFNIFNHENCKLNDHERAYQFIIKNIDRNENSKDKEAFCILLGCLEGTKLSEKSIKDSVNKQNEHFGFMPKSNDSFICSVNKNIKELQRQVENKFDELFSRIMQQHQQALDKITRNLNEKIKSIESKCETLSNKIDTTQTILNEIQSSIQQTSQKIENEHGINQQNVSKIENIQVIIQQISHKIENEHGIDQQNISKIDNIQSNVQQISQKVENLNNISNRFSKEIECIHNTAQLHLELDYNPFSGIIRKLGEECGGDVYTNGIVNVTSSSIDSGRSPQHAVDFDNNLIYFCSNNAENSWLQYDFKNKKVRPTHYSIKTSHYYAKGLYGIKSIKIEGSNDQSSWVELDNRINISTLDGILEYDTFAIQKKTDFYQYLRITQTGPNSGGSHYLIFSALEYFGSIM